MNTEKKPLNLDISSVLNYLMQNHKPEAYTQAELARRTGIPQATIRSKIRGKNVWTISELEKIAPHLGIPVWEIIGAAEKQDGALFRRIRLAEIRNEMQSHMNAFDRLSNERSEIEREMERRGELEK